MLKRVKNWLGIEGTKVILVLPDTIRKSEGVIRGDVRLSSMHAQTVTALHFKLVEKYQRGRKKSKLTDEYVLAEKKIPVQLEIPEHEVVEIPFELPYNLVKSKMDQLESRNVLMRGIIKAAKNLKSVRSEYRLEVEAKVSGTALNPFDRQILNLV